MGMISDLFKKPIPILKEEDRLELANIKREAYMKEARKLMEEKGKLMATQELGIKKPKEVF